MQPGFVVRENVCAADAEFEEHARGGIEIYRDVGLRRGDSICAVYACGDDSDAELGVGRVVRASDYAEVEFLVFLGLVRFVEVRYDFLDYILFRLHIVYVGEACGVDVGSRGGGKRRYCRRVRQLGRSRLRSESYSDE